MPAPRIGVNRVNLSSSTAPIAGRYGCFPSPTEENGASWRLALPITRYDLTG